MNIIMVMSDAAQAAAAVLWFIDLFSCCNSDMTGLCCQARLAVDR